MDLRAAEVLLEAGDLLPAVCFHAQQAAEKALKGYLAWLGAPDIPKTHDLEWLGRLLAEHEGQEPPAGALDELLDFGVLPRYPGSRPLTPSDGESAVAAAQSVVTFARRSLMPDGQSNAPGPDPLTA